jgi:uncharacterized membrane protein YhaH (DUF805 family)
MEEYLSMWKNYFNFKDRTTVRGFWMAILFNFIAVFVLGLLSAFVKFLFVIYLIYVVAAIIPCLAIQIRRMHDINKSGFWIFLSVIPIVGAIIYIIHLCKDSVNEGNLYGTTQV